MTKEMYQEIVSEFAIECVQVSNACGQAIGEALTETIRDSQYPKYTKFHFEIFQASENPFSFQVGDIEDGALATYLTLYSDTRDYISEHGLLVDNEVA